MGKYEVTQAQWQAVMGSNPSHFQGDNLPVEMVSWNDCQTFIQQLNQLGQGTFRLPTEAEWECACRAGTTWRFSHGNVLECGDECESCTAHDLFMWWCGNSGNHTHEVGSKLPNPWGLYDMHGNVWELCNDWWEEPWNCMIRINPTGVNSGSFRVARGGSLTDDAGYCRSAYRLTVEPVYRDGNVGLRIVVSRTQ